MSFPLVEREFKVAGGDFMNAGKAASAIKEILKESGFPPDMVRRAAICAYEAEMNIVLYAKKGTVKLLIYPDRIVMKVEDEGPGIEDIELAMKEGYSTASPEMREMGFGAGMGLPNIKKNSDYMSIESELRKGTRLEIVVSKRW